MILEAGPGFSGSSLTTLIDSSCTVGHPEVDAGCGRYTGLPEMDRAPGTLTGPLSRRATFLLPASVLAASLDLLLARL